MHRYLAVDLGAESGRLVLGTLADGKLELEEIHRFKNGMLRVMGHYHWNTFRLFEEMLAGLRKCNALSPAPVSLGVNTWGVDFGLLGPDGMLWGAPIAYRDPRTDGLIERFAERMPQEITYGKTGIAFQPFNTLYQLMALAEDNPELLSAASDFLMMPDLFHYFFTGNKVTEFTLASTSQMVNVETGDWDADILDAAGIPQELMPAIYPPGTDVGGITQEIREQTGFEGLRVIAPACHDTAAAVAAVPAEGGEYAYISSGTWSLMGMEVRTPVNTEAARACNLTNEGGVDGTYRLLKNIMGLWLVQRCRAGFDATLDYAALTKLAEEAPAFVSLINPNDARFFNPVSMPDAIAEFCKETGQPVPDSPGAYVRCCLESLALEYRWTVGELRRVQDAPIRTIHIVGGGTQNTLLSQFTADATGLPVVAGPVEATAIGNLLVQAQAQGHVASLAEARAIVRASSDLVTYSPKDTQAWDAANERFEALKK